MDKAKKVIEKNLSNEEINQLQWLYRGINTIGERAKIVALEEFPSKIKGALYLQPQEFDSKAIGLEKKLDIPSKYKKEIKRYSRMLTKNIASILDDSKLEDGEIGIMLGPSDSNEYLLEIKKGKGSYYVHIDKKKKRIEMSEDDSAVPKKFKNSLEKVQR